MRFNKGNIPWNKGKKCPQFSGAKHPLFGKPRPESVKEKLRQANIGKKHSPDSIAKMSRPGALNQNWKGGRIETVHGYILIHKPEHPFASKSGYVPEHRLIVEEIIGRILDKKNQVHHIGERNDNRPHQLIAFTTGGAHRRFEFGREVKPQEIIFDGRKLNQKPGGTKNEPRTAERSGADTIAGLESALGAS